MFDQSQTSLQTEAPSSFPDWQLVQYLLPSLVTLIGDIAQAKSKHSELEPYVSFLHHLIQSYEINIIKKPLHTTSDELPVDSEKLMVACIQKLKGKFAFVLTHFGFMVNEGKVGKNQGKYRSVDWHLDNLCFSLFLDIVDAGKNASQMCHPSFFSHFEILESFLSRMLSSILKVELLKANTLRMMGNLMQVC
jgi:hypothetical protein